MGYLTQDVLASKLGKTQSTIANKIRLLNLDDDVQEALLNEQISERHARSLLKLTSHNQQRDEAEKNGTNFFLSSCPSPTLSSSKTEDGWYLWSREGSQHEVKTLKTVGDSLVAQWLGLCCFQCLRFDPWSGN